MNLLLRWIPGGFITPGTYYFIYCSTLTAGIFSFQWEFRDILYLISKVYSSSIGIKRDLGRDSAFSLHYTHLKNNRCPEL